MFWIFRANRRSLIPAGLADLDLKRSIRPAYIGR